MIIENEAIDYTQHLFTATELLCMHDDEVWKTIDFIPNVDLKGKYLISNYGRVISLCREKPIELIPFERKGYYSVDLSGTNYSINRLVALAFIPNPYGKPIAHHKDGNKHNNCYKNLAWATDSENVVASVQQRKFNKNKDA